MKEDSENGQLEEEVLLSPESIERIYDIYVLLKKLDCTLQEIPRMAILIQTIAAAQTNMATAASSMAATIAKGEERYSKLEDRLQDVNDRAAGKGQVPLLSHYMTLISAVMVTVLVVLYINKQQLDASLTQIKVSAIP